MNLRWRFVLWIAAAMGLSLVLYSAAFLVSESRHLTRQAQRAQAGAAAHLAHACGEFVFSSDDLALLDFFKELRKSPGFREALCLSPDGRVLLGSALSRAGERLEGVPTNGPARAVRWEGRDRLWDYWTPVSRNGRPVAVVRLTCDGGSTEREVRGQLGRTAGRSAGVAAGAILLAVGLAWVAAGALVRPIRDLAQGARRLAAGDWRARVPQKAPGELGQLAREFNEMGRRLGDLDRWKDRMVHTVSHDLRNPLSAMATMAKMLGSPTTTEEGRRSATEALEASIARLAAMVNNILDTARLREGALTFRPAAVDLRPLFSELDRLYRPLADRSRKGFSCHAPNELPRLWVDEEKMFRVLLNLLTNAFKFTGEGDRVELTAVSASPDRVRVSIQDTGRGIPRDRWARLFAEEERGGASGDASRPGEGLGLSIVTALVEGQGGTIEWDSVPDRGTTVRLLFPTRPAA